MWDSNPALSGLLLYKCLQYSRWPLLLTESLFFDHCNCNPTPINPTPPPLPSTSHLTHNLYTSSTPFLLPTSSLPPQPPLPRYQARRGETRPGTSGTICNHLSALAAWKPLRRINWICTTLINGWNILLYRAPGTVRNKSEGKNYIFLTKISQYFLVFN